MAEKPVVDETSPEFTAAVEKAAEAAAAQAIERLMAGHKASASGVDDSMFERLALAIAEVSDQGTQRKRVAPEILSKREKHRKRMGELLVETMGRIKACRSFEEAQASALVPEYRIVNKTQLNERVIEPFRLGPDKVPVPVEIYWTGAPNECMRPLNEIANAIFDEFMGSIGNTVAVATADTRPLWVTFSGLTVKGVAPIRRQMGNLDSPTPDPFQDALGVKGGSDPRAEFVHVLGTIAAPARQNYYPQ